MSDDLVFGEVKMSEPEKSLRPDRNRHYAVVALGDPHSSELPIYVDLDVMRDMDEHALSDTSVELGGVLLGGQHHDDDGQPFVVITDSLRAQHYESTKGSFKFTHETWSAITRERDEFPPDCQMVGWYHTHPDWGVFLSGMDLFICNNFFNKPLDVAYVIDPCRQDRGMFQWINPRQPQTKRVGGFYVISSRFRQQELEDYVAALSGEIPMPGPHDRSSTVVNLHGQQPPWMGPAMLGMLSLQFCLLALIAWKMIVPPTAAVDPQVAALLADKAKIQREVLDKVLAELKDAPEGYASSLEAEIARNKRLQRDLADRQELADARAEERNVLEDELTKTQADALATKSNLQKKLASAESSRDKYKESLATTEEALKKATGEDKDADGASPQMMWILGGGIAFLAVAAAGAAVVQWRGNSSEVEAESGAGEQVAVTVLPARKEAAATAPKEKEVPAAEGDSPTPAAPPVAPPQNVGRDE